MRKALFDELQESIREAGRIHRGEQAPSRSFVVTPEDADASRQPGVNPSAAGKRRSSRRSPKTAG